MMRISFSPSWICSHSSGGREAARLAVGRAEVGAVAADRVVDAEQAVELSGARGAGADPGEVVARHRRPVVDGKPPVLALRRRRRRAACPDADSAGTGRGSPRRRPSRRPPTNGRSPISSTPAALASRRARRHCRSSCHCSHCASQQRVGVLAARVGDRARVAIAQRRPASRASSCAARRAARRTARSRRASDAVGAHEGREAGAPAAVCVLPLVAQEALERQRDRRRASARAPRPSRPAATRWRPRCAPPARRAARRGPPAATKSSHASSAR